MAPCNCQAKETWRALRPDGSTSDYRTATEAQADVLRNGGTYSRVG